MADRPRVILALPDVVECATIAEWLAADGVEPIRHSPSNATANELYTQVFDLLIADGAVAFGDGLHAVGRVRNPLTPMVVIGNSAGARLGAGHRRAIHLARPVERVMLMCTVSLAILDGRPIRRSERKPVNRFAAVVNGVPSHIIDVSAEGLRLEVPRGRRLGLPPYFSVKIPLIGVAATVQRMWARPWPGPDHTEVTWCGGALSDNRPATIGAWRAFVDTIPVAGESLLQIR